jgi:hypothetical protein
LDSFSASSFTDIITNRPLKEKRKLEKEERRKEKEGKGKKGNESGERKPSLFR